MGEPPMSRDKLKIVQSNSQLKQLKIKHLRDSLDLALEKMEAIQEAILFTLDPSSLVTLKRQLNAYETKVIALEEELRGLVGSESVDHISKQKELEELLAQFSKNCTKAKALEVEEKIFELVRDDEALLLANSNQYVAPAREAIAVVTGRMLHGGTNDKRLVQLLEQLANDPDKWVRKKANDGLVLSGQRIESGRVHPRGKTKMALADAFGLGTRELSFEKKQSDKEIPKQIEKEKVERIILSPNSSSSRERGDALNKGFLLGLKLAELCSMERNIQFFDFFRQYKTIWDFFSLPRDVLELISEEQSDGGLLLQEKIYSILVIRDQEKVSSAFKLGFFIVGNTRKINKIAQGTYTGTDTIKALSVFIKNILTDLALNKALKEWELHINQIESREIQGSDVWKILLSFVDNLFQELDNCT